MQKAKEMMMMKVLRW